MGNRRRYRWPVPRHLPSEYGRFLEAVLLLTAASMAIRWLPFGRLVRSMGSEPTSKEACDVDTYSIRLAVKRASARLPWRTVCFQEGLAAHWLLRRRGVDSRLHYGIRPAGNTLSAHVWVEVDGQIVIGEEERDGGHVRVAVFPSASAE